MDAIITVSRRLKKRLKQQVRDRQMMYVARLSTRLEKALSPDEVQTYLSGDLGIVDVRSTRLSSDALQKITRAIVTS